MYPTSTNVKVALAQRLVGTADAVGLIIGGAGTVPAALTMPDELRRALALLAASRAYTGKPRQVVSAAAGSRLLLAVGLGSSRAAQAWREAAAALARAARRGRAEHLALAADIPAPWDAVVEGAKLALFRFTECKGTASRQPEPEEGPSPRVLTLLTQGPDVQSAVVQAGILADAQNLTRTLAYRPANQINPPELARLAADLAKQVRLRCRILTEHDARKLGMGGLLAVGSGSATPPRLICLEHRPVRSKTPPVLLVGKSITFDTGGVSIKPAEKMGRMIFDKCGGLAVLGAMVAAAQLRLPVPVVGLLAAAENHLSGHAYRPGDVLRMYNGVTVEVTNTDAEGRLVLGDALAWGTETYRPAAVVDLATLTGGVVVALGRAVAGVMANDDGLVAELAVAAERSGEKFWRLPLGEEYKDLLKSEPADIANAGPREASPIQGGMFLSHFVPPDVPWAHVDIAGVADTEKELPLYAKGPTGWGVRMLVHWMAARGG